MEALLNHLRVPWRHRKHVRTTNLIERSFVEERRRTKTIPRFFTEKSGLKLVHATLIRAADNGQRVGITATERAQLNLLYQELEIQPVKELQEQILTAIRKGGCTYADACLQAGISKSTFQLWKKKGQEQKKGSYRLEQSKKRSAA